VFDLFFVSTGMVADGVGFASRSNAQRRVNAIESADCRLKADGNEETPQHAADGSIKS
jgi:hypothetical protein